MKICYLSADLGIPLSGNKGAAVHVWGLVEALRGQGHEVNVISPAEPALARAVEHLPITHSIPAIGLTPELVLNDSNRRLSRALNHLLHNVQVAASLSERVAEFSPDVIYERYSPFGFSGVATARQLGVPHVLEVNAPLAWEGATFRKQAMSDVAAEIELSTLKGTDRVIVVSEELRKWFVEVGVPAEHIEFIPNGVDVASFRPAGPRAIPFSSDQFVVGFVGNLRAWHGVDVMVEAARTFLKEADTHLLVVGDGPERKLISDLALEHPHQVTHVEQAPHEQMPQFLRSMDVAIAPYADAETFYFSPLKLFEYMATGRAIVAARIGQVASIVKDGTTGLLFPPGDVAALLDAIQTLKTNPDLRLNLGCAAAADAHQKHGWPDRATKVTELVNEVIAEVSPLPHFSEPVAAELPADEKGG